MSVTEKHRVLLEAFSLIPDRQERLAAIVERGRRGPVFPAALKTSIHQVPGCVSPVWVSATFGEGLLSFRADADAPVVKGLVRLLCELYDGASPAEVVTTEPRLLEDLDLVRDLSPTRRNGLAAVRSRLRALAILHLDEKPS